MPPSIVLEALQILAAEIELREETRVTEQARAALAAAEFGRRAGQLADRQAALQLRCEKLSERIAALPEGESLFGKEIRLLTAVSRVMQDAADILARPETGSTAIAAETEAIELLLQSKRMSPGGGGGGTSPGGGGGGTTSDAALAMVGQGVNAREVRKSRIVSQSTGDVTRKLPEEFRAGLDEYFNRILEAAP